MDELVEGQGHYVEIDGFHLAVFLNHGQVTAIDSTCPHAGANLADGSIEDDCAVCPWHFWAFRLDNGQRRDAPGVAVRKYPTRQRLHDGKEFVQAELPTF